MTDAQVIQLRAGSSPRGIDREPEAPKLKVLTGTELAFHDAIGAARACMEAVDLAGGLAVDPSTSEAAREGRRLRAIALALEAIDSLRAVVGALSVHNPNPTPEAA